MPDGFLLLTPVLILAIVALMGFIGCRYGFDPIQPPKGLTADPHCIWIYLSWNKVNEAKTYDVIRNDEGNEQIIYQGPDTSFRDTFVVEVNHNYPAYRVRSRRWAKLGQRLFSPGHPGSYVAGDGQPTAGLSQSPVQLHGLCRNGDSDE